GDPDDGTIAAIGLGLEIPDLAVFLDQAQEVGAACALDIKLMVDAADAGSEMFGAVVTEHARHGGVGSDESSVRGGLINAFDGVFEGAAIATFCFAVDGLGLFFRGGILNMAGHQQPGARMVGMEGGAALAGPTILAVAVAHPILHMETAALGQSLHDLMAHGAAVTAADEFV